MKFFLFSGLIGSMLLVSVGCQKNSNESSLYGNWKLTLYTGGFSGGVIQPRPDSVCILSLQSDQNYKKSVNGTVNEYGTYSISDMNGSSNVEVSTISFTGEIGQDGVISPGGPLRRDVNITEPFRLNKDTLLLNPDAGIVDGETWQYVRVR